MESYVVKMRRQFHMYPEVGFDLPRTLATIRAELEAMGVAYTEAFGKSSIVATVNPENTSFTIGVRADIDALPIREENDVPYKSRIDGQMHACGHDCHAAMLLDTVRRVQEIRDRLRCRVKFIFQAAEEYSLSGAMLMVNDGVMQDIDCIVGLHVDTNFKTGYVAMTPGPQNATSDGFLLDFYGTAAHAANQEKGVDANLMAMRAFADIEFMIAKTFSAKEPIIFNVGAIHGGVANNILCDHCQMFCTLRTWNAAVEQAAIERIQKIIACVAESAGGRATYTKKKHYPIVCNHEGLTALMRESAVRLLGEDKVGVNARALGGEDFSYFANEKPGCFIRLGIRPPDKEKIPGVHNGCFDVDEAALEIGPRVFLQFILDHQDGIAF